MGPDGFPGPKGIRGNTGLFGPRGDGGLPGASVEGPEGLKGYPGKSTPTLGCTNAISVRHENGDFNTVKIKSKQRNAGSSWAYGS